MVELSNNTGSSIQIVLTSDWQLSNYDEDTYHGTGI